MNALVIDDERSALHLFFDKVINKDDEVTYYFFEDNLNKIFSFLKNTKVDLIFLDIRMNSIDGRALAEKIHILYPQIKFVFFTGLTITEKDLPLSISDSVLGILYKPFNEIQFENIIKKSREEKNILRVNMLGSFDCFINENIVNFSSAKSKELFALLLLLNGKSLTMDYAISVLWPDKDLAKAKILYRDAVWRLRTTLNEINFPCIEFKRAMLNLNKENIDCDFLNNIELNKKVKVSRYLLNYERASMVIKDFYSES